MIRLWNGFWIFYFIQTHWQRVVLRLLLDNTLTLICKQYAKEDNKIASEEKQRKRHKQTTDTPQRTQTTTYNKNHNNKQN